MHLILVPKHNYFSTLLMAPYNSAKWLFLFNLWDVHRVKKEQGKHVPILHLLLHQTTCWAKSLDVVEVKILQWWFFVTLALTSFWQLYCFYKLTQKHSLLQIENNIQPRTKLRTNRQIQENESQRQSLANYSRLQIDPITSEIQNNCKD